MSVDGVRIFSMSLPQLSDALIERERTLSIPLDWKRGNLSIVVDSRREFNLRAQSCAKEPETVAWLERECKPGEVLYDVGACVGAYSLVAASLGARVVAFEPSAHNYRQLVRNVELNRLHSIIALPLAAGAGNGFAGLRLSSDSTGAASHTIVEQTGPLTHAIAVVALDLLGDLPKPTLMKIDVDGYEVEVIKGALETIEGCRSVMIETDDTLANEVAFHMEQMGFTLAGEHQRLGGAPVWNREWRRG